jgi:exodeoxyribonuclease VII small subunit
MAENENGSLTFEDALARLEAVVDKMERGSLPLDQMIKSFEEGSKLSSFCGAKLRELEKKIEILVRESAGGQEWAPFDPETGPAAQRAVSAPSQQAPPTAPPRPALQRRQASARTPSPPPDESAEGEGDNSLF